MAHDTCSRCPWACPSTREARPTAPPGKPAGTEVADVSIRIDESIDAARREKLEAAWRWGFGPLECQAGPPGHRRVQPRQGRLAGVSRPRARQRPACGASRALIRRRRGGMKGPADSCWRGRLRWTPFDTFVHGGHPEQGRQSGRRLGREGAAYQLRRRPRGPSHPPCRGWHRARRPRRHRAVPVLSPDAVRLAPAKPGMCVPPIRDPESVRLLVSVGCGELANRIAPVFAVMRFVPHRILRRFIVFARVGG